MKRNTALLMAGASWLRTREAGDIVSRARQNLRGQEVDDAFGDLDSVNPETVDGEDEDCYIYHGSCLGILRSFPYCYGVARQEMISV